MNDVEKKLPVETAQEQRLVMWKFFETLKSILLRPRQYFQVHRTAILRPGDISFPLFFAVALRWFALFLEWLWNSLFELRFETHVKDFLDISWNVLSLPHVALQEKFLNAFFSATTVLLAPFPLLLKLFFSSFLMYLAGVALIPQKIHFSSILKIVCLASAPAVFALIPIVGSGASWVLIWIIGIVGIQSVFQVSSLRAILIVFFPKLFFLGALLCAIAVLFFLSFQFLKLVF